MLSEGAQEILEALWIQTEEQGKKSMDLGANRDDPAIEELTRLGFIRVDKDHMHLLDKGKDQAISCVRRHRLSERLLMDVFDIKKDIIDEVSCKFEHLLHQGLEDRVCTLLGHPKICPHGKSIPSGKCCKENKNKAAWKIISSLDQLDVNDKGQVAYLQARDKDQMQKLISIGALPGVSIVLKQEFPSYIFQIAESQFAVDKELAQSIYVRLTK